MNTTTPPPYLSGPKVQWEWIAAGWNLFLQQWQPWVLNILVFLAAMFLPVGLIMVASFVLGPDSAGLKRPRRCLETRSPGAPESARGGPRAAGL